MLTKKKLKKAKVGYLVNVRSRHPSHLWLKQNAGRLPFKSIVRLGSTTEIGDEVSLGGDRIECNTVASVLNSSNKLLMKKCFDNYNVNTAAWFTIDPVTALLKVNDNSDNTLSYDQLEYPVVAKYIFGSRNRGNYLLKNELDLLDFIEANIENISSYIFEKYYSYNREYRIHMAKIGNVYQCIYTCRKVLKNDTPEDQRWFRNDSNSAWYVEDNPAFDKPINWDDIIKQCGIALASLGLDIGAFDVRVQSAGDKDGNLRVDPKYIIIESNSAASHGDITRQKYKDYLPLILFCKYNDLNNLKNGINNIN